MCSRTIKNIQRNSFFRCITTSMFNRATKLHSGYKGTWSTLNFLQSYRLHGEHALIIDIHPQTDWFPSRLPRNLFWAKQRVRITGLGSPNFFKSIRGIKTIHEVFNRHIPASSCQEWNYTLYEEHPAVDFQCSYFAKDGDEFAAQFPKNVDPFGILTRAGKQKGLRISTDCLIEYYERTIKPSGDQLYVWGLTFASHCWTDHIRLVKHNTVDPAILRRGHLVEVTMAFQLIRTKRGKWLMLAILRSIEVLSRHIDEVSFNATSLKANSTHAWSDAFIAKAEWHNPQRHCPSLEKICTEKEKRIRRRGGRDD